MWITLALTWVQDEILAGTRTSTDVLSIISMRTGSELIVDAEPVDWLLFNKLIGFLRTSMPGEPGNYLQAIDLAEKCLMGNMMGSCALALLFFSDGRPSDRKKHFKEVLAGRIGALASRFGRRLAVCNIGFAAPSEEFSTLQAMTDACAAYQCQASFHKPTLTAQLLHSILTGLSSTLTNTKTELIVLGGAKQKTVRDVRRESQFQVTTETAATDQDWWSYPHEGIIVRQEWKGRSRGWSTMQKHIQQDAIGVAMKKQIFGEGAERMVRKFREFDVRRKFVGPWMVAKQSRFVEDENDADHKMFHRSFCSTQLTSEYIAKKFNKRLATIPGVISRTPRIKFLDCQVYLLRDSTLGATGVLVEKMLDVSKYKKWNSNNRYVDGVKGIPDAAPDIPAEDNPKKVTFAALDLGAISEEDEEGEEGEDSESDEEFLKEDTRDLTRATASDRRVGVKFTLADIPQAFSCFSYSQSNRRYLVCDLPGVLDESSDTPCFELTDPVIHYRSSSGRKNRFGRTDQGQKGIESFYKTHKCSDLCKALETTWIETNTETKKRRRDEER